MESTENIYWFNGMYLWTTEEEGGETERDRTPGRRRLSKGMNIYRGWKDK